MSETDESNVASPGSREERIERLWGVVDFFEYKLSGDGRIRDTSKDRVRVEMGNVIIRGLSELEKHETNKQLEEMIELKEELQDAVDRAETEV